MVSRLGGIAAPGILALYELVRWLPGTLFGVLAIVAGVMSWFLPETYGAPMLMSFDQAKQFYDGNVKNVDSKDNKNNDNEGFEKEESPDTSNTSL